MRIFFFIVSWAFVITSCIHPLEYNETPQDIVVIEGFIDDDYGPHEIQVTLLSTFAGILDGGQKRFLDAKVTIFDDLGNAVNLQRETYEGEDLVIVDSFTPCIPPRCECFISTRSCPVACIGRLDHTTNFLTPEDFKGVHGRCYSIEVILEESGTTYRSEYEMLKDPVPMDSIFFEFKRLAGESENAAITGVDVYGSWSDPPEDQNFYLFQVGGTYRIETGCSTLDDCLYDPRDELGEECWVVEKRADMNISLLSDRIAHGQNVIENIGFIEDDGKRFSSNQVPGFKQYYAEVISYTISEEAYNFYSNVGILGEINGEIFDPPPVRPIGNVYSQSNPNEVVIGFFGAFAKARKGAFVDRAILEDRKFHGSCGDCRYFNYNGQLEMPEVYK